MFQKNVKLYGIITVHYYYLLSELMNKNKTKFTSLN